MGTTTRISELSILVKNASTPTAEGRQVVVNCCKELYQIIEKDVIAVDKEWMLAGMYKDLCTGNFAEPFMCERKKSEYHSIVSIYNKSVIPNL